MLLSCRNRLPKAPASENTNLSYQPNNGIFLYCNNPEQLFDSDLGDHAPGFGNHYLLWSEVSGYCQAYYEHENQTGHTIGYGLQIFNPHNTVITINVTNIGFSNNAFDCWTQFFSGASGGGGTVGSITLNPGEYKWIQQNNNAIPTGAIFNGVLGFNVTGGSVYVSHYAYADIRNIDGTANYLGYVTRIDPSGQNEAHVYKGIANGYIQSSMMNASVSFLLNKSLVWRTNDCPSSDMVTITCPLTDFTNPTYTTFTCANGDNLGNWGIRNAYTVTISNDTNKTSTVHLVVAQPYFTSNVYVVVQTNIGGCSIRKSNWNFYNLTLPPNSSQTVTYEVILSGSSYGGLINSIVVK